jgi:hypothetical protein
MGVPLLGLNIYAKNRRVGRGETGGTQGNPRKKNRAFLPFLGYFPSWRGEPRVPPSEDCLPATGEASIGYWRGSRTG